MISLKEKGAPDAIYAYGRTFLLDTDFRKWLDFPERINEAMSGNYEGYCDLFLDPDNVPIITDEILEALKEFHFKPPVVPRDSKSGVELIDYDIDADLIYASFMQAYGIDLTEVDLHWHKFSALLSGIPGDTPMATIIGYRSYDGKEKEYKELRAKWALPMKFTEEEQKQIDEFNKLFG